MVVKLNLSVQYADSTHDWQSILSRPLLRRWVKAALQQDARLTLRFVDEVEGRELNHTYRGKDYATNVLSFPYDTEPVICGDLVICVPVVEREAGEQGKALMAHYAHLVVHGVLHLQGYDHETSEADADLMEAKEAAILENLLCFNHG